MKISWEDSERRHSSTMNGIVGRWTCFTISWNSNNKTRPNEPYELRCDLPGIKSHVGYFSLEEAKAKAERVLASWLTCLGAS